jgi:3-dehydroquinate dehydratase-2
MKLLVLNGPNLNLLGTRETDIYGSASLADLERSLRIAFPGITFEFAQHNAEGELIDAIQNNDADGIIFNPAGYSHTSVALRDAIAAVVTPVVEVHISNIHARERFRRHSFTAATSIGVISGLGLSGYHLAVHYFLGDDWG